LPYNDILLAYHMIHVGVDAETIRRFIFDMSSVTSLPEDMTKQLVQLLSNMAKANELIDEDLLVNNSSLHFTNYYFVGTGTLSK
jgi:hypothetical protein